MASLCKGCGWDWGASARSAGEEPWDNQWRVRGFCTQQCETAYEAGAAAEREIQLCGPAVEELVEWASSSECLDDPEDEAHLRAIGARIHEEGRRAGQAEAPCPHCWPNGRIRDRGFPYPTREALERARPAGCTCDAEHVGIGWGAVLCGTCPVHGNQGIQTRRQEGELRYFDTLAEAMIDAKDPEVWKVSFNAPTGERVRLVRNEHGEFVYENLMDAVISAMKDAK